MKTTGVIFDKIPILTKPKSNPAEQQKSEKTENNSTSASEKIFHFFKNFQKLKIIMSTVSSSYRKSISYKVKNSQKINAEMSASRKNPSKTETDRFRLRFDLQDTNL